MGNLQCSFFNEIFLYTNLKQNQEYYKFSYDIFIKKNALKSK